MKRTHRHVVKWNMIFYGLNYIYTIMIGLILVPIYLKYIPKDLYGFWLATGNILALIALIDPGIGGMITQKVSYYYGKGDTKYIGSYSFAGLVLSVIIALFVFLIGFLFLNNLNSILVIPLEYLEELENAFFFMLIGTSLMIVYYAIGAIDYGLLSSISIGTINLLANILGLIAIVVFFENGCGLLSLGYSAVLRSLIYVLGSMLYTIYRFHLDKISFRLDFSLFKDFLKLSFYSFLGNFSQNVSSNINSFVCTKYISPILSANLKFTQTVPDMGKMILLRVLSSISPSMTNLYGSGNTTKVNSILFIILKIFIWFLSLMGSGFLIFNQPFIKLWIGSNNYLGNQLNSLVILLLIVSTFNRVIFQLLFNVGKIKEINIIAFSQSILYIILLVPASIYWKVEGILGLGLVLEILFFAFYYRKSLFNVFPITSKEKKSLFKEALLSLITSISSVLLFYMLGVDLDSWIWFVVIVMSFVLVHSFILSLVSENFRQIVFCHILKMNNTSL